MIKNKLIVLNHKMNLDYNDVDFYIKKINECNNFKLIITPSYIYLDKFVKNCNHEIASQNVSQYESGNYTGEVSLLQLKKMGVLYSLIGHSERKIHFNEQLDIINDKVKLCYKNNITPIICVGESLEEKDDDLAFVSVNNQINHALLGVDLKDKKLIIAYEPIYAIGSGKVPSIHDISVMINYINNIIKTGFKIEPIILYGGSVDKNNIQKIMNIQNIHGVLIGSKSSDIDFVFDTLNALN